MRTLAANKKPTDDGQILCEEFQLVIAQWATTWRL